MYVNTHILHMHVYIHISEYAYIHLYVYVHINTYMYLHVCIYTTKLFKSTITILNHITISIVNFIANAV
jgi:hypothetical protein